MAVEAWDVIVAFGKNVENEPLGKPVAFTAAELKLPLGKNDVMFVAAEVKVAFGRNVVKFAGSELFERNVVKFAGAELKVLLAKNVVKFVALAVAVGKNDPETVLW